MGRKSENKSLIINTAAYLFWIKGYEAVGVNDICQEAGINKGTLYHFFSTKQEIALDVIKSNGERTLALMDKAADKPGLDRVLHYLEMMINIQAMELDKNEKFAGCPFGNFSIEMAGKDNEIRKAVNDFFEVMIKFIQDALAEYSNKKNLRAIATEIFTHWEGLLLMSKTANSMKPIKSIKSYTKNMFKLVRDAQPA